MKSFFVIASLLIGGSIACSGYKSSGSQALTNTASAPVQSATQTNSTGPQEKTPCTLTLTGAPDINGLRLGMTPAEVLALFPGSKEDAEVRSSLSRPPSQFGVSGFLIRVAKY